MREPPRGAGDLPSSFFSLLLQRSDAGLAVACTGALRDVSRPGSGSGRRAARTAAALRLVLCLHGVTATPHNPRQNSAKEGRREK